MRTSPLAAQLVDVETAFAGYGWYDALTTMTNIRFEAEHQGGFLVVSDAAAAPGIEDHVAADIITMRAELVEGERTYAISALTDVVFVTNEELWSDLDGARIVYRRDIDPGELAELIEAAYFEASSDTNCDSWDTQLSYLRKESRAVALRLLRGADDALCDKFRSIVQEHKWLLPSGACLHIIVADQIDVRLENSIIVPS